MTKFTFVGLEELKADLRNLPKDLRDEATEIVRESAESAADAVRSEYSHSRQKTIRRIARTGNLVRGVKVKKLIADRFGVAYGVLSTAPHVYWIERGTEVRHYVTVRGKKKLVGRMPGYNIFGPILGRHRRYMWAHLSTLLMSHGLNVSGSAAA